MINSKINNTILKQHFLNILDDSPLSIKYADLVGKACTSRADAQCNGIVQAVIEGQKRNFISDWPADNFIRWAQALGFIEYNRNTDEFSISNFGVQYSQSEIGSDNEYNILEEAFLSYPPVSRIMILLIEATNNNTTLTKFEIGEKLGFIGEEGFTSISQRFFIKSIANKRGEERNKIRSNWEGDSDKYARMICSWLFQLKYPWIEKTKKEIKVVFNGQEYKDKLLSYTLTPKGFEIKNRIIGRSRHPKVSKIVSFEMLSTKGADKNYLRKRRAIIIKLLTNSRLSLKEIKTKLEEKGLSENNTAIENDINGLINIGLNISLSNRKYKCNDEIKGLEIPTQIETEEKSNVLQLVEFCNNKIEKISKNYLVLISMAFDKNTSRLFEIKTIELLTLECKFDGTHLGGVSKPDGIIYNNDFGVIIDTKSYKNGFRISASERDKMKRYIDENQTRIETHNRTQWWLNFPDSIQEFLFLFVSGKFIGNFTEQLRILSEQTNDTLGGVMSAVALLLLADKMAMNQMTHEQFKEKISCLADVDYQE